MESYTPPLETDCLFNGGTTAASQSNFLRLNGEAFKNKGREYPHDRTNKLAELEEHILQRDYGVRLKREAFRTLKELIKAGQVDEKARIARLSVRTSGRKVKPIKTEVADGVSHQPRAKSAHQMIHAPILPVQPSPTLPPRPVVPHASHDRPRISTMIKDLPGDHALRPVLMLFVKGVDITEVKRGLGQVAGEWRAIGMPSDCRAALEWVDAQ